MFKARDTLTGMIVAMKRIKLDGEDEGTCGRGLIPPSPRQPPSRVKPSCIAAVYRKASCPALLLLRVKNPFIEPKRTYF